MKTIKLKSGTELPLMNLKGKDYLQVAHRLVWFREEHPDWSIETEFLSQTDQSAVCKATIKDANGRVIATSHKEESSKDFAMGHREKAETGSIGRALALCGYGTQFEPEFDEETRIVDSPVVVPEQPSPADGNQKQGYVMPAIAGRLAGKYLEDIAKADLEAFIDVIDKKYEGKTIPPATANLHHVVINRIVALENGND